MDATDHIVPGSLVIIKSPGTPLWGQRNGSSVIVGSALAGMTGMCISKSPWWERMHVVLMATGEIGHVASECLVVVS